MNIENEIRKAVESFETLLREQLARTEGMAQEAEQLHANVALTATTGVRDFDESDKIVIGICSGDGIGPVIMNEAKKLLRKLLADEINNGKIVLKDIKGLTIENRLEKNQPVPDDVLAEIKSCDVILKGPTTTPKGGTMESANVTLRRELDLYANVRPVALPEEGIDWVFFRENTEGEYVLGSRGIEIPGRLAMDFKVTTDLGTKRIARSAFEYARANGKNRVSVVTKANIMKKTDGNFAHICRQVGEDYPGIVVDDWYIDIMAANLVNKSIRNQFQVFLLPNLYGDIITDEAAEIQGGVGTAGSANIGDKYAMFEAIHGSAPRMVEEGLAEYANPSSIFKAAEMMVRHIGLIEKANKLAEALYICNEKEKRIVVTGTAEGAKCSDFAEYVMSRL